ncbi:protein kinase [Candidatus Gracilibacteria bacterium]|nr:protein kinase [Candidatus Gracilibacteria bacterium]
MRADKVARQFRRTYYTDRQKRLLTLCCEIADVYAHLHQQGFIHADVHPGNVLVHNGSVFIIDYGLAVSGAGNVKNIVAAPRGGVGYYFEPEYALAHIAGETLPTATYASDQYALAAMIFHLITGAHYLFSSIEKEDLYRQIAYTDPYDFAHFGIPPWPEVEQVLRRALHKDPDHRYPSVEVFAATLRAVLPSADQYAVIDVHTPSLSSKSPLDILLEAFIKQTRITDASPLLRLPASSCSVIFGRAGIAYALYRIACLRNDPQILSQADLWSNMAQFYSTESFGFIVQNLG